MGKKKTLESAPEQKEQNQHEKQTQPKKKNDDGELEIIVKFDFLGFFGLVLFNIALFYGVMTCAKEGLTKAQVRNFNNSIKQQF